MSKPTRFRKMYSAVCHKLDWCWREGKASEMKEWTHKRFRRISKQNLSKDINDA
jgi:hypothetical protein